MQISRKLLERTRSGLIGEKGIMATPAPINRIAANKKGSIPVPMSFIATSIVLNKKMVKIMATYGLSRGNFGTIVTLSYLSSVIFFHLLLQIYFVQDKLLIVDVYMDNQKKESLLASLFARRRSGIKPGLERILLAVGKCGNPERNYKTVHLAGTNGKGSTATMIASGLRASGEKVGLFTSPHICDFNERFLVNGQPVSDESLLCLWQDLASVVELFDLTFFEISALFAFELFHRESCTWAVIETGLGGRFDATNIICPKLSVITAMGIDHREFLGDTIEEIMHEKLGIVKEGVPCVINGCNSPDRIAQAQAYCREKNAECIVSDSRRVQFLAHTELGQDVCLDHDIHLELPLRGDFQLSNMITAFTALTHLGVSKEACIQGIESTYIPGRMQKVVIDKQVIFFDVAHNPHAMQALSDAVSVLALDKPTLVLGMMHDKDIAEALMPLLPLVYRILCVSPKIPRAADTATIARICLAGGCEVVIEEKSVVTAIVKAQEIAQPIIVTGSFYTVSEAMNALGIAPYGALPHE